MKSFFEIALFSLIAFLFITGCEGPMGPAGKDVEGVDVVSPTVFLVQPQPFDEVYDELDISVSAIDNVAIQQIVFNLDGSPIFVTEAPPYETTFELTNIDAGWHFVTARAYDTAGNITDTPVISVKLSFSETLNDTFVIKSYNSGIPDNTWQIPDTTKISAFWSKFTIAKDCFLKQTTVHVGGVLSDTAGISIEVWRGNKFPTQLMDSTYKHTLTATDLNSQPTRHQIDFGVPGLEIDEPFFILIKLESATEEDTLRISADNGDPSWGRSGAEADDEHVTLNSRFARPDNLLIDCLLYYEEVISDTTEEGEQ